MHRFYTRCLYSLLMLSPVPAVAAEITHSVEPSARFRLAYVDPDTGQHGRAASALVRGHWQAQWHPQWHTEVTLDHVARGWTDHHSTGDDGLQRPVIPDTGTTQLGRLLVGYRPAGANHPLIHVGRQTLAYDNQRLIGSDDFWLNERTFDAASARVPLASSSRIDYAYVHRVAGIGPRPDDHRYPVNDYRPHYRLARHSHRHQSHLARLEWNEWDYLQLVGYAYRLDNRDAPAWSNNTLGTRARFSYRGPQLRYRAELDLAQQTLTGAPGRPAPDYRALDLAVGHRMLEASARHEYLGSDDGHRFITPLGSNYRFQGLTGQITPAANAGLQDDSLTLTWRRHPWRLDLRQHWFTDTDNRARLGRELNLELQFRITRQHQFNLRYGRFSGVAPIADEQRLYLDYSFNR